MHICNELRMFVTIFLFFYTDVSKSYEQILVNVGGQTAFGPKIFFYKVVFQILVAESGIQHVHAGCLYSSFTPKPSFFKQ